MRLSRGPAGILFLLLSFFMPNTKTQLPPGLADFVTLNGVKTLVGDVLTLDNTFNKCIQKRLCEEFSKTEEHVEEFDPVKRSWSVQRRIKPGRLRWIGDMIATGLSKVARKVGFLPDPNRRNDGMMGNMEMVGKFATKKFEEIPMDRVQDVMDFTTDTTDVMDRKGNVYPLVKAAGLGYGIGHKKMVWEEDGDMQGCCTAQIGPDCGSFWHHLKEYNDYNYPDSRMMKPGGLLYLLVSAALSISQKAKKPHKSVAQSRSIDEQTYSSRKGKMIGPESEMESIKGKIVDEELKKICDQRYFQHTNQSKVHKEYDSSDANGNIPSMQERKEKLSSPRVIQSAAPNSSNQPIIVFEGLPPKFPDETEEELVGSILEQTILIPKTSVIKALRMPMVSQSGHSLVMVQMNTRENEQKVLEKKSEIRSSNLNLDHVGIREMNDIMWWNLVQELTVVKRVV